MLWAIRLTHAVGNASNRQFFTHIKMAIGHKDFSRWSVLLLKRLGPHLRMTLAQLRRIAPGAGQITAHRGDFAARLMDFEHAGFEQIQVIEKVKIGVKELLAGQIDVIEGAVATTPERRDALVGGVVDGEMGWHVV